MLLSLKRQLISLLDRNAVCSLNLDIKHFWFSFSTTSTSLRLSQESSADQMLSCVLQVGVVKCCSGGARLNRTWDQKEGLLSRVNSVCVGSSFCCSVCFRRFNWFVKHFTGFSSAHKDLCSSLMNSCGKSGFMLHVFHPQGGFMDNTMKYLVTFNSFILFQCCYSLSGGSRVVFLSLNVSPPSSPIKVEVPADHCCTASSPRELLFGEVGVRVAGFHTAPFSTSDRGLAP